MNLQFYIEKLKDSEKFKSFIKVNPESYLCSGFFSIDKENSGKDDKVNLDYFNPEKKEAFSFEISQEIKMIQLEQFKDNPDEISDNSDFNFDEIENIVLEEMKNNKVEAKIQKLILSLQKGKGKEKLGVIVFISMLGIVKMSIDLKSKEVSDFEKKSFFDMFKVIKKDKKD